MNLTNQKHKCNKNAKHATGHFPVSCSLKPSLLVINCKAIKD